jgi:hypothetical protein
MSNLIKIIENEIYENKNTKINSCYEKGQNNAGLQQVSKFEIFICFLQLWLLVGFFSFNIHKLFFIKLLYFFGYSDWQGNTVVNFASNLTFNYFLVVFMLVFFIWFFFFFVKKYEERWTIGGLLSFVPFFFLPIFVILFIPLLSVFICWIKDLIKGDFL